MILILSLFGQQGCARTTRIGDAELKTQLGMIGPKGYREWELKLPEISLTKAGSQRFHIRNLPRIYPNFRDQIMVSEVDRRNPDWIAAPWYDTAIIISVCSPNGPPVYETSHKLGQWLGLHSSVEDLREIDALVATETDFDLLVAVEHPSNRRGDRVRIYATATTNDLEDTPRKLYLRSTPVP